MVQTERRHNHISLLRHASSPQVLGGKLYQDCRLAVKSGFLVVSLWDAQGAEPQERGLGEEVRHG